MILMGVVLLGEAFGKAVRVTEAFPGEYGDGFTPLVNVILDNLEFRE